MISKYLKACFHIIAQTMARDSVSYWREGKKIWESRQTA